MDRTDRRLIQRLETSSHLSPHRRPGERRGPGPLAHRSAKHWIPVFAGMTSKKWGTQGSLLWQLLAAPLLWLTLLVGIAGHAMAQEKITYVLSDFQGTILAEVDEQGNVTKEFDYRPYGAQVLGDPADGPGYTGHVNDADTDLLYMQARYYDPMVGRFLSVDPKVPEPGNLFGFNRYAYANNSPLNFVDPDGREAGYTYLANGGMSISYMHREFHPAIVQGASLALDQVPIAGGIKGAIEAHNDPTLANIVGAAIGAAPGGGIAKAIRSARKGAARTFSNLFPTDVPRTPNVIPNQRLRTMSQKNLAYVVKQDGTLVVGKNNTSQGHIDLAGGLPVLAAGELRIHGGEIKYLDNYSGHYRPSGVEAQRAAEDAFRQVGFEVDGKYIERSFE